MNYSGLEQSVKYGTNLVELLLARIRSFVGNLAKSVWGEGWFGGGGGGGVY